MANDLTLNLDDMKERLFAERERWFVFIPALFACGIGAYFSLPSEPSIWLSIALVEALLAAAWICRFRPGALLGAGCLAIVLAGFCYAQVRTMLLVRNLGEELPERVFISAKVEAMDYNSRGRPRLILSEARLGREDGRRPVPGKIRLVLAKGKNDIAVGECIGLRVGISRPLGPSLVGGYQFGRKAFFEGIAWSAFPLSKIHKRRCWKLGFWEERREAFGRLAQSMREGVKERIYARLGPGEAGVAASIVAGYQGLVPEEVYSDYRDSGLAHFLSISGVHMSMLAAMAFFFVRLLVALVPPLALRFDSRRAAAVSAIFASFVYLLISGAEVPAQRAFMMTFIVLLGVLFSRQAISMKTITWAGMFVLLVAPEALVGPSFQMSFAAVFALIAFYEKYASRLRNLLDRERRLNLVWLYLLGIVATDLAASSATLPFAIYHFNRVAVFTTIGNFLCGPVIGLAIMPFVLLALAAMPFGLEAPFLWILGQGIAAVNAITAWVASLDGASQLVVSMPTWGLALVSLGGVWLCAWQGGWRKWGFYAIGLGFLSIATVRVPDAMVNGDKGLLAVKDTSGNLVICPVRGRAFDKRQWLDKSASRPLDKEKTALLKAICAGEAADLDWIDMRCDESTCRYKGLVLDKKNLGASRSIWLDSAGKVEKVITVDEYVGERPWRF